MEGWILGLIVAVGGFGSILGGGLGGWVFEKLQNRGHENRITDLEGIVRRHTDQINANRGVEAKAQRRETEAKEEEEFSSAIVEGLAIMNNPEIPAGDKAFPTGKAWVGLLVKYPNAANALKKMLMRGK